MIWTTWRLNRLAFSIGLLILGGLLAFLLPTGLQKLELFKESGLESLVNSGTMDTGLAQGFIDSYGGLIGMLPVLLPFVVVILGVMLATPLVMDLEQRTYRLAWTQSFTRNRWFLTKLGFALLGAAVFGSALSLLFDWWYGPLDSLQGPFGSFNLGGIVPVAYTILSLALALFLGTLSRNTIVAVVVALLVVIPVWGGVMTQLRGTYNEPVERVSLASEKQPLPAGAWLLGVSFVDEQGNRRAPGQIETGGVYIVEEYQPADRFWTFQFIESGILISAAVLLLGAAAWVINRRMR